MSKEQPSFKQSNSLREIIEVLKIENKITPTSLRFYTDDKTRTLSSLSFENIFLVADEKVTKSLIDSLVNYKERMAIVIGGGIFSLSELLDVMNEPSRNQFVSCR